MVFSQYSLNGLLFRYVDLLGKTIYAFRKKINYPNEVFEKGGGQIPPGPFTKGE